MQNNHRTKVWLASLLLIPCVAQAQLAAPPVCRGRPLSIEEQIASAPPVCDGISPACERVSKDRADLIFVGTVITLNEAPAIMLLEGVCTETRLQTVTLLVKESFSGSLPQTITVHAGYINGFWFSPKETALVFANKLPDGELLVSGCQTNPVGNRFFQTKEDLAYLRSRDKLPPTGSLLVGTSVSPDPTVNGKAIAIGFGNQPVTIDGPISTKITTSNGGDFRLDNLPPGKYTLHLDSSLHVEPDLIQHAEILPKGCAAIRFYLESDTDYKRILSSILKARVKK